VVLSWGRFTSDSPLPKVQATQTLPYLSLDVSFPPFLSPSIVSSTAFRVHVLTPRTHSCYGYYPTRLASFTRPFLIDTLSSSMTCLCCTGPWDARVVWLTIDQTKRYPSLIISHRLIVEAYPHVLSYVLVELHSAARTIVFTSGWVIAPPRRKHVWRRRALRLRGMIFSH
jgi:hypothetical protein